MQPPESWLITGTRSARVHRRRGTGQALVDKQLDLNASILCTTFTSVVFRNWICFAVAIRRHDPAQRNLVVLNQVPNDGIGTTLAQLAIQVDAASRIRVARNLEHVALGIHRLAGNAIESRL